jgi:hypothetical protein
MTAVSVEITEAPGASGDSGIEVVSVADLLSRPQIAPGCGDSNPYQQ